VISRNRKSENDPLDGRISRLLVQQTSSELTEPLCTIPCSEKVPLRKYSSQTGKMYTFRGRK
jgi:hypothetical protein